MTHWKVRVVDEAATHRATEIMNLLLDSTPMINALEQTPWYLALREINRRYEAATYNEDGEAWVHIPKGTHDANAVFKVQKLFPGILEIQEATVEEVAIAVSE